MDWMRRARHALATPVDSASLVWFRVAFGCAIAWEMWRYYANGWIARYWIEPRILFPYWPFTFVHKWPAPWMMYAHVAVVALAALAVAVGWRYRWAIVVLFFGFAWLFLLDQTRYLNHFYLICLLAFLLSWLPADCEGSLDVASGRVARSTTVPAWTLLLLRFMVGVPYFYGGIAKLQPDWMSGSPMLAWIEGGPGLPLVGSLLTAPPVVALFTWGGLFFDLIIVPVMLWPRTRVFGMAYMLAFHILNSRILKIGIFPWMMILLTLVFLPPDWPLRVWDDLREPGRPRNALALGALVGAFIGSTFPGQPSPVNAIVAAVGVAVFFWEIVRYGWDHDRPPLLKWSEPGRVGATGFALGAAFVLVQLVVPLRHFLIPGDVSWTEEGHRWSWHMKLRDKDVDEFVYVVDPPGDEPPYEVDPRPLLARHQYGQVAQNPEMTVQLAHHLAKEDGRPGTAVYVRDSIRLNGREGQPMIDPNQDLTQVHIPWWPPAPWIVPLRDEPESEPERPVAVGSDEQ